MTISDVQGKCLNFIEGNNFQSYDLYDALTNPTLNRISKGNKLLRRAFIQINAKSPINLHWTGMKKMVHTKTISDLLWYYAISEHTTEKVNKVNYFFEWLLSLKNEKGYGWGLNFPYTSRFIDAGKNMPNLYNTINSGIAICYSIDHLTVANKKIANDVVNGILEFLDKELGFIDEGTKGWYSYYPGQTNPTYNVNALTLYFLTMVKNTGRNINEQVNSRIEKILNLLITEQEPDGSWFYSRSESGKWIDGFHSAFVIESIAFAFAHGYNRPEVKSCLVKGRDFYIEKMFTADSFPRYFSGNERYPIESQNVAQAIQTLSVFNLWMNDNQNDLLVKNIHNALSCLYNKKGYLYHKKTRLWTYKQAYFRWSVTPMILALEYARKSLKSDVL